MEELQKAFAKNSGPDRNILHCLFYRGGKVLRWHDFWDAKIAQVAIDGMLPDDDVDEVGLVAIFEYGMPVCHDAPYQYDLEPGYSPGEKVD